ncbi:MAG: DNA translocase FtsK, partial [Rhizobiaceae bacterium]|nr:DNA translocase FtsK [Rhizobiaceae bacterium]
ILFAAIAGCIAAPPTWPLPTGLGGVFGDMVLKLPGLFLGGYPTGWVAGVIALVLLAPSLWLFAYGSALIRRSNGFARVIPEPVRTVLPPPDADDLLMDDDEEEGRGSVWLGIVAHWWLSTRFFLRRHTGRLRDKPARVEQQESGDSLWRKAARRVEKAEAEESRLTPQGRARIEPEFFASIVNDAGVSARREPAPAIAEDEDFEEDFDLPEQEEAEPLVAAKAARPAASVQSFRSPSPAAPASAAAPQQRVAAPAPRPAPGQRVVREAQTSMLGSGSFEMPTLHFLAEPKGVARDASLSEDALEQNARLLEGVLEDFGVKGEIIQVRPGPVVTLYELEPAPGIKSSRVIGLADDIARSMSAIACRVAVVPGRNAIGIELPNTRRETVYLREIVGSRDFETSKAKLALALGKTINGEAVVVDIAKMPHVLVAGTTGSGKSVAINTMILSLLYRLTPDQCRLIMIDPKMLELSVYDGIPHLLTPVVTDPKKAVVALKWTVREMEDRYRKMSKVGVRNIDGFNARVTEAEKKGERISRTVQTGFDRETGEAIYETEELDLEPMPYIVVIIDEMADLMMVAGKDIEGAVQRLAQMARAAGIHVIMATQRPSVDVITGTIKANFPTRISFQVTSKIDSRTILGEQGAEQLLGMGDMLYMAGGGRIQRVHGPFVSDDEVEKIVAHLKLQGAPEYLDAITADDGDDDDEGGGKGGSGGGSGSGNFDDSDDPYDQAVAVVLRDGKASTSYIQRRLGIGYNRAASIIEKMEKEGIVGPANHAGKREILVPTEDDKM